MTDAADLAMKLVHICKIIAIDGFEIDYDPARSLITYKARHDSRFCLDLNESLGIFLDRKFRPTDRTYLAGCVTTLNINHHGFVRAAEEAIEDLESVARRQLSGTIDWMKNAFGDELINGVLESKSIGQLALA